MPGRLRVPGPEQRCARSGARRPAFLPLITSTISLSLAAGACESRAVLGLTLLALAFDARLGGGERREGPAGLPALEAASPAAAVACLPLASAAVAELLRRGSDCDCLEELVALLVSLFQWFIRPAVLAARRYHEDAPADAAEIAIAEETWAVVGRQLPCALRALEGLARLAVLLLRSPRPGHAELGLTLLNCQVKFVAVLEYAAYEVPEAVLLGEEGLEAASQALQAGHATVLEHAAGLAPEAVLLSEEGLEATVRTLDLATKLALLEAGGLALELDSQTTLLASVLFEWTSDRLAERGGPGLPPEMVRCGWCGPAARRSGRRGARSTAS